MNTPSLYKAIAKYLLVLTALVPLVVTRFSVYPFVFGKGILFMGLVQVSAIFTALYFLFNNENNDTGTRIKNKYHWGILLFFLFSMIMSTCLSLSPYVSFWGTTEKGDGLFLYFHFIAFVVLTYTLFDAIDWMRLSKSIMGSAIIISLLAWGERFTYTNIDFQPISSLGNPAYLASYLLLALAFIFASTPHEEKEKYKSSYVVLYAFLCLTICMLQVRGAILGLGVGMFGYGLYTVFSSKHIHVKRVIGIICSIALIGGVVFIATRTNPVWLQIPVVKKFAVISLENRSVAERISAWKAGIEGFSARPIFGWGNEQFTTVYNFYGKTDVEKYNESWFSSAHNKVIDVLVNGGVVGLLAYGMLILLIVLLLRKKTLALGIFCAYLIQNMFIFDTISSSIVFFALIGYLFFESKHLENLNKSRLHQRIGIVVSFGVLVIATVFFVYSIVIPLRQQINFSSFLHVSSGEKLEAIFGRVTEPFNHHQKSTRIAIVKLLREYNAVHDPRGRLFFIRAVGSLEQIHQRNPRDMETVVALLESYIDIGEYDSAYYDKAVQSANNALLYAPRTYTILHLKSEALLKQRKFAEASASLDAALLDNPNSYRTHVYKEYISSQQSGVVNKQVLEKILSEIDENYRIYEKRDFLVLLTILARNNDVREVSRVSQIALGRYSHEKKIYAFECSAHIVEKNSDAFLRCIDAISSAPYARSLPINYWRELRAANKWEELSKDTFFADAFAEFRTL